MTEKAGMTGGVGMAEPYSPSCSLRFFAQAVMS